MKKRFLVIAIAAGLVAPSMASAGDINVYGRAHLSLDSIEVGTADAEFDFNDRKSAFGVKGKEDLGGGTTVFYKAEWSFNPADTGSAIGVRDRYLGVKMAGMGTFKFGTMSSNYKQTAAKMDPFWHTAGEGRATGSASALSGASGDDGGRMSNLAQFSMAPMGGMNMVVNVQLNGSGEMTTGLGLRYKAKDIYAFVDMLSLENDADADGLTDHKSYAAGETAIKFGGKYTMGATTAGLTLEQTEDVVGYDYTTVMATHKVNENDTILFTYGMASHATTAAMDADTLALGYNHAMSKRTSTYAAVVSKSSDTAASEISGFTLGLKHKF